MDNLEGTYILVSLQSDSASRLWRNLLNSPTTLSKKILYEVLGFKDSLKITSCSVPKTAVLSASRAPRVELVFVYFGEFHCFEFFF